MTAVLGPLIDRLCTCQYDGQLYILPSRIPALKDPNEHQPTCGYRRYVLGQALLADKDQPDDHRPSSH